MNARLAVTFAMGLGLAGTASAAEILVTSDITVSTTWTANNTYNLQGQVYVRNGATLTIEPGTVVASTTNLGGSLAVTRGSQIFVNGTADQPVIMTSKADVATWTAGDPKTGTWREGVNEWGNLTIMGRGYVSEDAVVTNTPAPSASNVAPMEGLIAAFPGDPDVLYGGGDDDDNSGTIQYLSLRYGGRVVSLNNELNGMSLGGIGRGTDIHHVEIMNNVDDGIETWGGTVNLKYISVWNVGDDSMDFDQGWRGKAQFGLVVQGYSADAPQGSGVGDNCFETDGAEDSDWQPVTTAAIYNFTVIGQPQDGDHGTAWRDNARVQYHNCIFMDLGDEAVRFDNDDGDGASGYGHNMTLSWPDTWTTDYTVFSTVNAPAMPADFYKSQTSGKLAEITDSVFYNNTSSRAYTEALARGVFAPANNNVMEPANSPIRGITRAAAVVKGGKIMERVTYLDPRAANDAVTSVGTAPNDGFFTQAQYRGAFDEGVNWLCGWSASSAFGFFGPVAPGSVASRNGLGGNLVGFASTSTPTIGKSWTSTVDVVTPPGTVVASIVAYGVGGPVSGVIIGFGELLCLPPFILDTQAFPNQGSHALPLPCDPNLVGQTLCMQAATFALGGDVRLQNALDLTVGSY